MAALAFCISGCGAADRIAEEAVTVSGTEAVKFTGFTIIENNNAEETETKEPVPEADWDDRYSQFTLDTDAVVYNKADGEASVLGTIPAGSVVRSLGAAADGTWSRISYNGRVAYINVYKEGIPETPVDQGTAYTAQNGGYTDGYGYYDQGYYQDQQGYAYGYDGYYQEAWTTAYDAEETGDQETVLPYQDDVPDVNYDPVNDDQENGGQDPYTPDMPLDPEPYIDPEPAGSQDDLSGDTVEQVDNNEI